MVEPATTTVTRMGSDQEILLQKVLRPNSSTTLSSSCIVHPSRARLTHSLAQSVASSLPATSATRSTRIMSDSDVLSAKEQMNDFVCHSDSTEFEMPFGIDDDDLVNYQPPVVFSSRSSSAKYFNNRSSSKSCDLETFEEEDLNFAHPNKTDGSILDRTRSVLRNLSVISSSADCGLTESLFTEQELVSKPLLSDFPVHKRDKQRTGSQRAFQVDDPESRMLQWALFPLPPHVLAQREWNFTHDGGHMFQNKT